MGGNIRIGIVGMGAAGWAFLPAIRDSAEFRLAAVVEPADDVRISNPPSPSTTT